MASWIAFLPRPSVDDVRYARAVDWFTRGLSLEQVDEVVDGARAAAFRGRASGAARITRSESGWCVIAGSTQLPDGGDAELLDGLLTDGRAFLDSVGGDYAVAWFDARAGRLEASSDHLGRRHVFRAESEHGICYATSSIALGRFAGDEPDAGAVAEFLACGTNFEDRTVFRAVRRLDAASHALLSGGGPERTASDIARAAATAAVESVARLTRPLPDLTGGLDSRLLVSFLLGTDSLRDVTVTGAPDHPDARVATRLARRLGLDMHRVDAAVPEAARSSLEEVLDAAVLADGRYDAIEYAGVARIHSVHAARWDGSVNGSGGEMFRSYWWTARDLGRTIDPVERALPRFAAAVRPAPFLAPDLQIDPSEHFRSMLARTADPVRDWPAWRVLDLFYLQLRMQCWQGSISSATNRIWPARSPFLDRAPLDAVYNADPRIRIGPRLFHAMLAAAPAAIRNEALDSGFPPRPPDVANAWRFVPGLLRLPARVCGRVTRRLRPRPPAPPSTERIVRGLRDSGLRDWLALESMCIRPLLDEDAWSGFVADPRPSLAALGRVVAVESAFRSVRCA